MSNLIPNLRAKKLPTVQQAIAFSKLKKIPLFLVVFERSPDDKRRGDKFSRSIIALKINNQFIATRSSRSSEIQFSNSISASLARVVRSDNAFNNLCLVRVPHDFQLPGLDAISEKILFEIEDAGLEQLKK